MLSRRLFVLVALVTTALAVPAGAAGENDSRIERLAIDGPRRQARSIGAGDFLGAAHPNLQVTARAGRLTSAGSQSIAESGAGGDFLVTGTVDELRSLLETGVIEELVRLPDMWEASLVSEGALIAEVPEWQAAGWTGQGVKIAVLDSSFTGYRDLLGTELPPSVTAVSFHYEGLERGTNRHGTAVAEIVHDVAPSAELVLINADPFSLDDAVDFLIDEEVDVINLSGGWSVGPFDGTAEQDAAANRAIDAGIIWVNAAGNEADQHFAEAYADADTDGWSELSGAIEINDFFVGAGQDFQVVLNWDDPTNDLDLCLWDLDPPGGGIELLICSEAIQNQPFHRPLEVIDWVNPTGANHWYGFAVGGNPAAPATGEPYDVFVNPAIDLGMQTPTSSLLVPNATERVISVGAVPWFDLTSLEDFSSQGPTADGRVKPDLVAPDRVTTASLGEFVGTSSASPHVAGMVAVYLSAFPGTTPVEMRREMGIRAQALPVGSGKNSTYGWGRADLGALPPPHDWVAYQDNTNGLWTLMMPDGTENSFYYGLPSDQPVMCDWDGDGIDTVGLYRSANGFMYLRNTNDFGVAENDFFFGISEDMPICGDWDGDGTDTIGIYRPSEAKFYLRNDNSLGFAEEEFLFGAKGDLPFAGDWDGDGVDTVGLYRPTTGFVYITNENRQKFADLEAFYGIPGDRFVVGDWDGDGADSFGIFRSPDEAYYLSNTVGDGLATQEVDFGNLFARPVAGFFG